MNKVDTQGIGLSLKVIKRWEFALSSRTPDPCRLFNYNHPLAQRTFKGKDLRITDGYVRTDKNGLRYKTYLLYVNGKVEKEFNSVKAAKEYVR